MNTSTEKPWFVALDAETDQPQNSGYGFRVHQDSLTIADGVETLAQAHLIAAAPELLEACKQMLEAYAPTADKTINSPYGIGALHSAVRAAILSIAKAKGEE